MGQVCMVCKNSNRLAIDRMIVSGMPFYRIQKDYGINAGTIKHHAEHHLSRQLVQAMEQKDLSQSSELLHEIEDLLTKAKTIFNRNFERGKDLIALRALSEQRNTLSLLASIAVNLHQARALELQIEEARSKGFDDTSDEEPLDFTVLSNEELSLMVGLYDRMDRKQLPEGVERPSLPAPEHFEYADAKPIFRRTRHP